jgi:hypothetical protein
MKRGQRNQVIQPAPLDAADGAVALQAALQFYPLEILGPMGHEVGVGRQENHCAYQTASSPAPPVPSGVTVECFFRSFLRSTIRTAGKKAIKDEEKIRAFWRR